MKHLKKFNENKTVKEYKTSKLILDHEYIKNCFIEFVDNGKVKEIETEVSDVYGDRSDRDESGYTVYDINGNEIDDVLSFFIIDINGPIIENNISYSRTKSDISFSILKDQIKSLEELTEFYLDIDNSIDKVMIKYPNINYNISIQDGHYQVLFYTLVLKN